MSEEDKAIARRWNRIFEGQASEADEIIAPGIVYHDAPPGIPPGPAGVKQWAAMFDAITGMRVEEEFYIPRETLWWAGSSPKARTPRS